MEVDNTEKKTKKSIGLKKKKIGSKLAIILIINSLTIFLLGLVSFYGLQKLLSSNEQIFVNSKVLNTQLELEKEKDNINGDIYVGVLLNKSDETEVKRYKANFYNHINSFKKHLFILEKNKKSTFVKEIKKNIPDLHEFSKLSVDLVQATLNQDMSAFELLPLYKEKYEVITVSAKKLSEKLSKESDLLAKENKFTSIQISGFIVGFSIIALLIAVLISMYINRLIKGSVSFIQKMISNLLVGELEVEEDSKQVNQEDSNDELVKIGYSLNDYMHSLKNTADYAREIGKGNFELSYAPLSEKDELGLSLMEMKASLEKIADEDKKRNWATEGLAKFGEILRNNNDGLSILGDNIISNLVRYLGANQGGLFVVNDNDTNDKHLELIACYAWNKKKYINMRVDEGEGLVGQAWQENDTLFITDVPEDYVKITSGLGDANPKSFLIVPLAVNDEIFGVVEIAAFFEFEQYHIDFVNKLAESIASTLSTAKTNERTKILLEQSQQQTEEMRAQEEEMRQNMEEMQATQEEMERKEGEMTRMVEQMQQQEEEMRQNMEEMEATQEEMEKQNAIIADKAAESNGILDGINATMATVEFTPQGIVTTANANFLNTMKTELQEVSGMPHSGFVPAEILNSVEYKTFWSDLAAGKDKKGIFKRINAAGEIVWLDAIYNPIKNAEGKVVKVVKFATDITEKREMEAQSKAQNDIINDIAIVSKTDLKGNITYVNEEFLKWSKYTLEEVMGKNHRMLKSGDQEDKIFVDMWKTISSGKIFRGEIKNKAKDGSFYWVDAIIAPILDENGKPKEYIAQRFVINDVIEQKERDYATKKLYEGEINTMYDKWYNQLKRMEKNINSK